MGWVSFLNPAYGPEIRKRIECLVDLRDIDPEQADMVELERQALAVKREWPEGMNARKFWELLGGSLEIEGSEKQKIELYPMLSH